LICHPETIHYTREEQMTKTRITLILLMLLVAASLLFAIQAIVTVGLGAGISIPSIVSALLMGGLLALHLRGWAYSHVALIIVLSILIIVSANAGYVRSEVVLPIFVPTVIASIMLSSRWIAPVFLATLIGIALRVSVETGTFSLEQLGPTYTWRNLIVLSLIVAGLILASAVSRTAQREAELNEQKARDARHIVEAQAQALEREVMLAEAARAETEKARVALAEQLATIQSQRAVIQEMSVPVLPITSHALLMPLIGALDTARLELIQEQGLQALERSNARFLLLDISGVPIIDTQVAKGLLHLVDATRLLGAQVVVVGVRPEVAQSIVGLGLSFNVTTRATLQDGIAAILAGQVQSQTGSLERLNRRGLVD
jgi:rsbT co-antagonist protein RsbR